MPTNSEGSDALAESIVLLGRRARQRDPLRGGNAGYQIGGPAAALAWCADLDDLAVVSSVVRATGTPWSVLGAMSNSLIADRGIAGIVVRLNGALQSHQIRVEDGLVVAGGGVRMPRLAAACNNAGLSGIEWMVAIPGTIGGAIAMNAGVPESWMEKVLVSAEVFDLATGEPRTWENHEFAFGHRHSALVERPAVVVSATLKLDVDDPRPCRAKSRKAKALRKETQPTQFTTGSVFTNPAAWKLVDQAGFRGHQIGCARVANLHTNFIVIDQEKAFQDRLASDVYELMYVVRDGVREQIGVTLDVETTLFGFEQEKDRFRAS